MNLCRELRCPCVEMGPNEWLARQLLLPTWTEFEDNEEQLPDQPPPRNCILQNLTAEELAMLQWVAQPHWAAKASRRREEEQTDAAEGAKRQRIA